MQAWVDSRVLELIMIKLKLFEGVVGFDHVVDSHSTHTVKLPRQDLLVMASNFVDSHRTHIVKVPRKRLTGDGLIFYGYFLHGCFEGRVHTACIQRTVLDPYIDLWFTYVYDLRIYSCSQ